MPSFPQELYQKPKCYKIKYNLSESLRVLSRQHRGWKINRNVRIYGKFRKNFIQLYLICLHQIIMTHWHFVNCLHRKTFCIPPQYIIWLCVLLYLAPSPALGIAESEAIMRHQRMGCKLVWESLAFLGIANNISVNHYLLFYVTQCLLVGRERKKLQLVLPPTHQAEKHIMQLLEETDQWHVTLVLVHLGSKRRKSSQQARAIN